MIRATVDQNLFYLWKFDGIKVFQEHLQFKWCPSPSNDNDADKDYASEKGTADMHVWDVWSGPEN